MKRENRNRTHVSFVRVEHLRIFTCALHKAASQVTGEPSPKFFSQLTNNMQDFWQYRPVLWSYYGLSFRIFKASQAAATERRRRRSCRRHSLEK